jgi:hypothetical protein
VPSTFLEFLNWLLSFGPKLPQAMALIQHIVGDFKLLVELFTEQEFQPPRMAALTAEELVAEQKVLAELAAGGVAGERAGFLQNIWAFLLAHPELLTLLVSLLKKQPTP